VLPVVSPQQMKAMDELASRRFGMPSLSLMENAGRSVIDEMEKAFGPVGGRKILVVAGKGKNGGDGFVAGRYAVQRGATVAVLFLGKRGDMQGDTKINFDKLQSIGGRNLIFLPSTRGKGVSRKKFDFIIDAIFGTSFHGEVRGAFKATIEWINRQRNSKVIAVDIPSGLDALTGECSSAAVQADLTVSMALPKLGFYTGKGKGMTGPVVVADIQMPKKLLDNRKFYTFFVEKKDVQNGLPVRSETAHKQSVGKIFVVAGSKGLSGAALLCSQSAMKSGAGAVVLGIPSAVFPAVARRTLEVMPFELPSTAEGSVAFSALEVMGPKMKWADVILIGPGLSTNAESVELVHTIVSTAEQTLIVDADGLNALAQDISLLRKRKCRSVILTPHMGEFSRLVTLPAAEIEREKIQIARSFARKNNVILVLKGAPTIVAVPSGSVFVNSTGNPGMATAGSGDVLAGIIAALCGQHNPPERAAINGVFVHGYAGDLARNDIGEMGMLASDIMKRIPSALQELAARGKNTYSRTAV